MNEPTPTNTYELHAKATAAVRYAVQTGRLVPAKDSLCDDCGKPAEQYDHYLGYERRNWLEVQPVCKSCHRRRHRQRKRALRGSEYFNLDKEQRDNVEAWREYFKEHPLNPKEKHEETS